MSEYFLIKVYQQENDVFNIHCKSATIHWLDERLFELKEKFNLSTEKFQKIVKIETIKAEEILNNSLQNPEIKPDILFFPGGKSTKYSEALGKDGTIKIREYVKNGGVCYGICAGAYYAAKKMTYYPPDKETKIKYPKIKTYMDKINPILGIIDIKADGDPEDYYGKGDRKITKGAFIEVKSSDRNTAFVFTSMHLLGPYIELEENNEIKELARYGKDLFTNKLAGAVSNYYKGDVSIIGFHPELTPERVLEIRDNERNNGIEIPIFMADGRDLEELSPKEIKKITVGCNKFSDDVFLPDLFLKFCNHIERYHAKYVDLQKLHNVQKDLQNKIDKKPLINNKKESTHLLIPVMNENKIILSGRIYNLRKQVKLIKLLDRVIVKPIKKEIIKPINKSIKKHFQRKSNKRNDDR